MYFVELTITNRRDIVWSAECANWKQVLEIIREQRLLMRTRYDLINIPDPNSLEDEPQLIASWMNCLGYELWVRRQTREDDVLHISVKNNRTVQIKTVYNVIRRYNETL